MIYFIVTTCVYDDCLIRKQQYMSSITKLQNRIRELNIENAKIVIVENNGPRYTYLDELKEELFYTNNNMRPVCNKGYKELHDVFDCINKYNIQDSDLIVKITGRYFLNDDSKFMSVLQNIDQTNYECIIRYGYYFEPAKMGKIDDCITGLIAMSCRYVKRIEMPNESECVEWKWAIASKSIPDEKVCILNELGINICPASNNYHLV